MVLLSLSDGNPPRAETLPIARVIRHCLRYDRQADEAGFGWRVPYALRSFLIVRRLGVKNIGDKSLGVAIVQGEQAGLHLHHNAMAR